MVFDGRYVRNEEAFKKDASIAFQTYFSSQESFESFYASLTTKDKDEFLRVANFYLFLVKQGDWYISVPDYDKVIDYFTNSFKLVALFSLIESLTDLKHQDFYEWLSEQEESNVFPISNEKDLKLLYVNYKKSYGSIRRCVNFFEALPEERKITLCNSIQVKHKPLVNIKKLAQFLYELRSEFVHSAQLVLQLTESTTYHFDKNNKLTSSKLSLGDLLESFEEGVITYFKNKTT